MIIDTVGTQPFESYTNIQNGQNNDRVKYGLLMLLVAFSDKVTPDFDFADKIAVQCDVTVVEILYG